jgi:hypothetical protein
MGGPVQHDEFFVPNKDPNYVYHWANTRERVQLLKARQGYEIVQEPEEVPEAIRLLNPPIDGAASSTVRRRGDVVLMKIRKDLWERNVNGPVAAAKARSHVSAEQMVGAANDAARRALRARGIPEAQIPSNMVYLDKSEGEAGGQ